MKRSRFFETTMLDLMQRSASAVRNSPLFLGGAPGPNGGTGGPPQGATGQLLQTLVAYDTTEAATMNTSSSPSILDNLNHIRAMIGGGAVIVGNQTSVYDEMVERAWWGW